MRRGSRPRTARAPASSMSHTGESGRDGIMTYDGTCEVDDTRFTASITTKRHTERLPTVFGDDQEVAVKLEGTCTGKVATYVGTAEQFPGVTLEGERLLFSEQQAPRAAVASEPISKSTLAKLPKLPKRFR